MADLLAIPPVAHVRALLPRLSSAQAIPVDHPLLAMVSTLSTLTLLALISVYKRQSAELARLSVAFFGPDPNGISERMPAFNYTAQLNIYHYLLVMSERASRSSSLSTTMYEPFLQELLPLPFIRVLGARPDPSVLFGFGRVYDRTSIDGSPTEVAAVSEALTTAPAAALSSAYLSSGGRFTLTGLRLIGSEMLRRRFLQELAVAGCPSLQLGWATAAVIPKAPNQMVFTTGADLDVALAAARAGDTQIAYAVVHFDAEDRAGYQLCPIAELTLVC